MLEGKVLLLESFQLKSSCRIPKSPVNKLLLWWKRLSGSTGPGGLTLSFEDGCFPSSGPGALVLVLHALQHGRVLQHVRQDQEADLASTDVDLLQLGHAAVAVGDRDVGHLKEQR